MSIDLLTPTKQFALALLAAQSFVQVFQGAASIMSFAASAGTFTVAVIALWKVGHVAKMVDGMNTALKADATAK
jgi:hypothetical protein